MSPGRFSHSTEHVNRRQQKRKRKSWKARRPKQLERQQERLHTPNGNRGPSRGPTGSNPNADPEDPDGDTEVPNGNDPHQGREVVTGVTLDDVFGDVPPMPTGAGLAAMEERGVRGGPATECSLGSQCKHPHLELKNCWESGCHNKIHHLCADEKGWQGDTELGCYCSEVCMLLDYKR